MKPRGYSSARSAPDDHGSAEPESSALDSAAAAPTELGSDELEQLVSIALELRDEGRDDWLAESCREHPHAAERVRDAVERSDSLSDLIASSAEHDPLRGERLGGRFQLIERIGVGAMGVVYEAADLELGRRVACKIVHHGLMAPEQSLERFAREAQALAAIQHASVVTIHDRGRTASGQVYIVMERIDGPPISAFVEAARDHAVQVRSDDCSWIRGALGVEVGDTSCVRTVVRWVADLALGLEAVHRAGVLHRDIKPSNILLRRDGSPVLVDFGIALLDGQGTGTRTSTSIGTPAYMPPEALRHDARTPASDVYSLAATLYQLLTLHAPYEGSPTQVLTELASGDPTPAAKLRPGLPRDLLAVLECGMQRNPARRYPTAAAFEADLRAFLEFRPVNARPITLLERGWRKLARSRAAIGALAMALVALLALGGNAWREHVLDARRVRHAELMRHLPPNFTIVGPANRVMRYDADRVALTELLDAAADSATEPLPTLMLRASFRQDNGDAAGAARDMERVAEFVGTPLARALASRYAALASPAAATPAATSAANPAAQVSASTLDLEELPAPQTPNDRYLLGYHLSRCEKDAEAIELLGDPDVRRIPYAEELFLTLTMFEGLRGAEQQRLAGERFADLVRLERRIGARTATTAHVASRLLAVQDKHEEASRACAEGIELAPRAFVLHVNAGHCAFVQGRMADAREHLEIVRDLRPNYAHPVQILVWVDIAERKFDAAAQRVREAGPGLVPHTAWWVDYWLGVVAAYAALDARASGDTAELARELAIAHTQFELVIAQEQSEPDAPRVRGGNGRAADTAYRIASALEVGDDQAVLLVLLQLLAKEPQSWWRQRLLLRHLPAQLDRRATDALRLVIEALDKRELVEPAK